ncbi:MAG: NlpC/P60 family protein [Thiotrichales bacterium]
MKLRLASIGIITVILALSVGGCARGPIRGDEPPAVSYWRGGLNVDQALIAHYTRWQGVPHRLGGGDRSGIDCSGFVQRTYQELFNFKLPRTARDQRGIGKPVKMANLRAGDLIFFEGVFAPHHVGIYLGDGTFVHVSSSKGVTRTALDDRYWQRYIKGAKRVI